MKDINIISNITLLLKNRCKAMYLPININTMRYRALDCAYLDKLVKSTTKTTINFKCFYLINFICLIMVIGWYVSEY